MPECQSGCGLAGQHHTHTCLSHWKYNAASQQTLATPLQKSCGCNYVLTAFCLQVKKSAKHAKHTVKHVMHDVKHLGKFNSPKLGKTAKRCLRVLAQVGVLGAAL